MRVIYTKHALDRMAERHVSESDVEAVLNGYLESVTGQGGTRYKGRTPSGRTLKVWVVPKPNPDLRVVKSVAWED